MSRYGSGRLAIGSIIVGILLLAAGCAAAGTGGGGTSRDLITAEEIQQSQASNVYQLIQTARGSWLATRGLMTFRPEVEGVTEEPEIIVYVDGSRLGGVNELQGVSTVGVTSIQRLSASEATQRFGTGHARGAILVSRGS